MATRLLLVSVVLLGTAGTVLPARRDCSRAACKDEVRVTCTAGSALVRARCARAVRGHCRAGKCSCAVAHDIGETGSCACPAGDVCRPAVSICDATEVCTGTSPDCPPDLFVIADFIPCREAAGDCDVPEFCTGTSPECPPDTFKPSTVECCGPHEPEPVCTFCTGTSAFCPIL
jgi:hypothetical protein